MQLSNAGGPLGVVALLLSAAVSLSQSSPRVAPEFRLRYQGIKYGLLAAEFQTQFGGSNLFLIDTGVSGGGVLDRSFVTGHHLKEIDKRVVRIETLTSGAPLTSGRYEIFLQQKGNPRLHLKLPMVDLAKLSDALGAPLAGALGVAIFRDHTVEFDSAADEMRFFRPDTYLYSGRGVMVPLVDESGMLAVKANVRLSSCEAVPIELLLDTASNASITLNQRFVEKHPDVASGDTSLTTVSAARNLSPGKAGKIHSLQFAGVSVAAPDVLLLSDTSFNSIDRSTDGSIGMGVLKHFRIVIDSARGRLILDERAGDNVRLPEGCSPGGAH